ncbi:MAG: FGGY-family carbohydrate kinase [Flaviflexus sp.]|uniref:FGGY-family carbohydrate kinase n=1 Tax=Flaviflexus sp. TaxID=1969482 RepID=UPI003F8FFEAA
MMTNKYVLGIDNGGTVTKAAIYDVAGKVHAIAQAHLETQFPRPLFTERDIDQFWDANVTAIRRVLDESKIDPADIAALAVTGHGNGIYLARKDGTAPRAGVVSTDGRAQSYVDRWLADPSYNDRVRSKTGSTVWAGQPPALLAWFDEHEPHMFDETDYVLSAKDFIRFRLTGEAKLEVTDSCGVGLSNVVTKELDRDVFDFYGISRWADKVPPFCESAEIAGYITEETAALTGLKAGTPVAGGVMDVAAGALAAGLVDEHELTVITGTWSINEVLSRDANIDSDEEVWLTMPYPVENTYLFLDASPNGVSNLDWYINSVIRKALSAFGHEDVSDAEVFTACEKMIHDFTPDVEDPFFLPYINGTDVFPEGRAGFVGMTNYHDIRHQVRAVYEGVIFSHLYHIEKLRAHDELLTGNVRFTGGAANSTIWLQMFADGIGKPLDIVDATESGTLGTAICSAVAAGLYPDVPSAVRAMTSPPRARIEPNPEFTELFAQRFERFIGHLEQLQGEK